LPLIKKKGVRLVNYFFLIAAIMACIYAYTFARWLQQKGNTLGALGIFLLIAISLALPIYRMISGG